MSTSASTELESDRTVLWSQGRHFFDRAVIDRVFGDNAEHPPLGRWLLGVASVYGPASRAANTSPAIATRTV